MSHNHYGSTPAEMAKVIESHSQGIAARHARNLEYGTDDDSHLGLSAWGEQQNADLYRTELLLAEAGWRAWFPFLVTLEGEDVQAPLVDGQYGLVWKVPAEHGSVQWVSHGLKPGNLAKKGYREEWRQLPAFADHEGPGTGLSGCLNVRVGITPHWESTGIERDSRSGMGRLGSPGNE